MTLVAAETASNSAEVVRRGKEIYNSSLRDTFEPEHTGQFLIIEVESGNYHLVERYEDLAPFLHALGSGPSHYLMRIGFDSMYRMGGGRIRNRVNDVD